MLEHVLTDMTRNIGGHRGLQSNDIIGQLVHLKAISQGENLTPRRMSLDRRADLVQPLRYAGVHHRPLVDLGPIVPQQFALH